MVTSRTSSDRHNSFKAILNDVSELIELQWQLIAANSRDAQGSAAKAVLFGAIAAGLSAVACLFVLGAIALALYQYTDLAMWSAFGIVGVSCLLLAGVLGFVAVQSLKHCTQAWNVSKQELAENIRWLKKSLSGDADLPPTQPDHANGSTFHPHFERQK